MEGERGVVLIDAYRLQAADIGEKALDLLNWESNHTANTLAFKVLRRDVGYATQFAARSSLFVDY